MLRFLPLVFKNSLRNRRRSILTISSIAVSLCLLSVLLSMYHALFFGQATPGQALRLVVRNRVSLAQSIPVAYEQKIRNVPGVVAETPWNWYGGTYKDSRDQRNFFARFGVNPKAFFRIRTQLEMPEEQRNAFLKEKTACIISSDLAETLHLKIGDRVVLQGDIYPVNLDLTVRGIFTDPDAQSSLFFNMAYLRDALPVGQRDMNGTVAILADSTESVPRIARQIDTMFEESPEQTKTESEQQFTLSFVSFLGNIKLFLLSICAAVTFTILLVSGNTMAMSVRERIKEVGVLKTLGFTNDTILAIIIGEALTIALIGGAIGIVLAGCLDVGVGKAGQAMMSQLHGLSVTPLIAAVSLGVALLIGLVSSFFPAWNAARTNILDSLRYSG